VTVADMSSRRINWALLAASRKSIPTPLVAMSDRSIPAADHLAAIAGGARKALKREVRGIETARRLHILDIGADQRGPQAQALGGHGPGQHRRVERARDMGDRAERAGEIERLDPRRARASAGPL
jgi:hypothetical protein